MQGLFAFAGDRFHHLIQETPELDHGAWFDAIGLPSHGPGFDALLRGKVTEDPDRDVVVVGFYGAAFLSNPRYRRVVEAFALDEARVVEKRLTEAW